MNSTAQISFRTSRRFFVLIISLSLFSWTVDFCNVLIKHRGLFLGHRHWAEKDLKHISTFLFRHLWDIKNLKFISQTGFPNIIGTTAPMNFDEKYIYTNEKRVRIFVYFNLKITSAAITGESLRCLFFNMQRNRKTHPISFIPRLEIDWFEKRRAEVLYFYFGNCTETSRACQRQIVDLQIYSSNLHKNRKWITAELSVDFLRKLIVTTFTWICGTKIIRAHV